MKTVPERKIDLQDVGENVKDVAAQLGITQATLYRAIKKLNYTYDVFNSDGYVRRVLCVYLSADGAKQAMEALRKSTIYRRILEAKIEKLERDNKELSLKLAHIELAHLKLDE